jgi:hypothetical protein
VLNGPRPSRLSSLLDMHKRFGFRHVDLVQHPVRHKLQIVVLLRLDSIHYSL